MIDVGEEAIDRQSTRWVRALFEIAHSAGRDDAGSRRTGSAARAALVAVDREGDANAAE